ncbi:MAG: ATP-binding cassette domain-containing protein [Chloracidobacterium sp.]|nr:ATP-binding cassette domain-containing protein [Chloracidobacterium sp.]
MWRLHGRRTSASRKSGEGGFPVFGPNGAGKTTTIRMIVGITAPDEGTITLDGKYVTHELQSRIGYLPEERGLYKKMRVLDQLRYFAALKDVPRIEAENGSTTDSPHAAW